MQFHLLVFATFASLIAPFGGFFASGLKRTFKIKDFGDSIPGHGGITDRMDCQFIMGFFAYMYYHSFIAVYKVSLGGVIEAAITGLTVEEQIELVKGISKHLNNQGALPERVCGVPLTLLHKYISNHCFRSSIASTRLSAEGERFRSTRPRDTIAGHLALHLPVTPKDKKHDSEFLYFSK